VDKGRRMKAIVTMEFEISDAVRAGDDEDLEMPYQELVTNLVTREGIENVADDVFGKIIAVRFELEGDETIASMFKR
jgi:hypothetical protein